MKSLREYLKSLEPQEQEDFAERCGTSLGYLRKTLSLTKSGRDCRIGESLAIALDRESRGRVRFDDVRSDVDWGYVRKPFRSSRLTTSRKCG